MAYMYAQGGSRIVGIDGVSQALDTFAAEHADLQLERVVTPATTLYLQNDRMQLYCGDFFAFDTDEPFTAIFDRASMVAIDPSSREAYVNVLDRVLSQNNNDDAAILLVALERTSGTDWDREGPPFSLPEDQVRLLYPESRWTVQVLEEKGESLANSDRPMVSKYYKIQRKRQDVPKDDEL